MDILALQSFVENALERDFPGEAPACRFVPLLDPALGDLGSDILKQLAKVRRESPEILATKVLPRLAESPFGQMRVVDGFLNLILSDNLLLHPLTYTPPFQPPQNVVIAPPHRGLDQVGYARVVSSAATHWFLSEQAGTLISAAGTLAPGAGMTELHTWLHATLCEPTPASVPDQTLQRLIMPLCKGQTAVWLYPDFLDRTRFRKFLEHLRQSTGQEEIHLQCLDRELLTRISDSFSTLQDLLAKPALLAPTLLYLSCGISGGDLDLTIPRNQERANIRWSLLALRNRLERVLPLGASNPAQTTPPGSLGVLERTCLTRAQLLPLFVTHACEVGAVANLLGAADELIEGCTRYLNDPRIRLTLDAQAPSLASHAIVSGVKRSISAIIRSCRLFQDPELVQP